jgi:hypothetical protein
MITGIISSNAVDNAFDIIGDESASINEKDAAEWVVFNYGVKTTRVIPKDIVSVLLNYIQRKQQQDRYGK